MSYALFCAHCGEIWGRVHRGTGWYTLQRPCERHGSAAELGGSFLNRYDPFDFNETLGGFLLAHPDFARHEFRRHLEWYDANHPQLPKETPNGQQAPL